MICGQIVPVTNLAGVSTWFVFGFLIWITLTVSGERRTESIGRPLETKFTLMVLMPGYQSQTNSMYIIDTSPATAISACMFSCLYKQNCLSLNFDCQLSLCTLFDDKDASPVQINNMNSVYGRVERRRGIPSDCIVTEWSEWTCSDLYCTVMNRNRTGEMEHRNRSIIDPDAYGGHKCPDNLDEERPCTCLNDTHILIIGGRTGANLVHVETVGLPDILEFIPERNVFRMLNTQLKYKRFNHIAVLYNDQQIIIDAGALRHRAFRTSMEMLYDAPLTASSIVLHDRKRQYGCGGTYNHKFYSCFGFKYNKTGMSHCDVYDLQNKYNHTRLDTNMTGRSKMGCLFSSNQMYVIAGIGTRLQDSSSYYSKEAFKVNIESGLSTSLSPLPTTMTSGCAVWFQGDIVICGIHNQRSHCFRYNLTSDLWVAFPDMVVPRKNHKLVNWGQDKILAIGGFYRNGSDPHSSIEVYNYYNNESWSIFTNMPKPLWGMGVVSLLEN